MRGDRGRVQCRASGLSIYRSSINASSSAVLSLDIDIINIEVSASRFAPRPVQRLCHIDNNPSVAQIFRLY